MESHLPVITVGDLHKGDFRFDESALLAFYSECVKKYGKGEFLFLINGDGYDKIFKPKLTGLPFSIYHRGNHDNFIEVEGQKTRDNSVFGNVFIAHGHQMSKEKVLHWYLHPCAWLITLIYMITGINLQQNVKVWNFKLGRIFGKKELFAYAFPIMENWKNFAEQEGFDWILINHIHVEYFNYKKKVRVLGSWLKNKERTYSYGLIENGRLTIKKYKFTV